MNHLRSCDLNYSSWKRINDTVLDTGFHSSILSSGTDGQCRYHLNTNTLRHAEHAAVQSFMERFQGTVYKVK